MRHGIMTRIFATVALLSLLAAAGCKEKSDGYQGYLEGEYRYISTPASGYLASLDVARGQNVANGAPLYSLDNESLALQLRQAKASYAAAQSELEDARKGLRVPEIAELQAGADALKATLERLALERKRQEELAVSGSTAQRYLDEARLQEQQARDELSKAMLHVENARLGARDDRIAALVAQVEAGKALVATAQWNLDQTRAVAPAAGHVEDTLFKTGEWIAAGRPVIKMLSPEDMLVYFFVPETEIAAIRPGMRVELTFDGLDAPRHANVTNVASTPEYTPPVIFSRESNKRLVYRVEGRLDATDAALSHPGQPVVVKLPPPATPATPAAPAQ